MAKNNGTTWVTFYSYKGGVGRTLSMVNAAKILADSDRRVVLVDFDLEAPGLDSYDFLGVPPGHQGLVEYFSKHLETGEAPEIRHYAFQPGTHGSAPRKKPLPTRHPITVIPAGRKDDAYNSALGNLDFQRLYQESIGQDMVDEFKIAVEEEFSPDYVLVDSRTGLTDVGGVCTFVLPDIVVLIYALNRQNVDGIGRVQNAIRKHALQKRDPIELLRVVSPFPAIARQDRDLEKRLEEVRKVLGTENVQVPYRAEFSYQEEPLWHFMHRPTVSPIAQAPEASASFYQQTGNMPRRLGYSDLRASVEAYQSIANEIIELAPRGIDHQLRDLRRAMDSPDEPGSAIRQQITKLSDECDRASVIRDLAELVRGATDLQDLYLPFLERAFHIDPLHSGTFQDLKRILLRRKENGRLSELLEMSFNAAKELQDKSDRVGASLMVDAFGMLSMELGNYSAAAEAFEWVSRIEGGKSRSYRNAGTANLGRSDVINLVNRYNRIEAKRRAGTSVEAREYAEIVKLFASCFPETARSNTAEFANKLQAISTPLALMGNCDEALRDLREAKAIAEIMPDDKVFSVMTYQNESPEAFARHCEEMADAIRDGHLWDGTSIPCRVIDVVVESDNA